MQLQIREFGVLVGLLLLLCQSGLAVQEDEVRAAVERGLAWVAAHPAAGGDGGFPDLVDEALFHGTIERLSSDQGVDPERRRAFNESRTRLRSSPCLDRWLKRPDKTLIEHYHLLLAAHLMAAAGTPMAGRAGLIEEAQSTLAESRMENPTFRLTVAQLLHHLDVTPSVPLEELLEIGLINRLARPAASELPGRLP